MKRHSALFFLILVLTTSEIPLAAAQYGEESTSLGQFVDEFTSLDNVSVSIDVVRNATLNAMELNYTANVPEYENYTTYTKVGADSKLTVTDYNISTNPDFRRGTEEGYYFDMGAGNIVAFSYDFDFVISDVEAGDLSSRDMGAIFMVNNWIGDQQNQPVGTYDYLSVNIRNTGTTDDQYNIRLVGGQNGAVVTNQISALQAVSDSIFYATIWRDGAGDCNVTIFSDSARTIQVLSLADTDGGQSDAFRYLYGWFAIDAAGDTEDWFKGSVATLWGGGLGMSYSTEGYFTTEDYLDQVNGSTLVLMTEADIPALTGITVEFSLDNSTWINATTLTDGFQSIDLRTLNWSTSNYLRYNLSGIVTLTPRLYQSRLITTEGIAPGDVVENVTGAWVEFNLTQINTTVGTHDGGFLNSTFFVDGDTWNCSEVVGAPGYIVSFNWTLIPDNARCLWLTAYVYYDGTNNHDIHIELYNFSAPGWVTLGHIYDGLAFAWSNVSVYGLRIPNDFVNSSGAVLGRFNHVSAGNINDDIFIDYLRLEAFIPSDVTPSVTGDVIFYPFLAVGIVLMLIAYLLARER